MASAYFYNQQGAGVPLAQQRGIPGQIGINPAQGQFIQQQQQQQQQYRNQAQLNDVHRKRAQNKTTRPNAPMTDDTDEPSGDELDDISARDIAMARYKRNHDYLSEIFTPYNAASIVPPSLELSQTKEELEKQIKEYKEKTQQQQDAYQKRLASLEKEQEQFWSKMNQLNQASTLDSINHVVAQLAQEMGVQIEHSTHNLKVVPIPGIEEHQPLQEQSQTQDHIMEETKSEPKSTQNNMDMYFEKDGEENNDSFFNEMVNTDDDPSVSEFLNTE